MFQRLSINQKFLLLILIIGFIFSSTFWTLSRSAHEIEENWTVYRDQVALRQKLLMDIKSHMGFGGAIHAYKNYVLRRNVKYFDDAREHLDRSLQAISSYNTFRDISTEEKKNLEIIKQSIENYQSKLLIARALIADGTTPVVVDDFIRIDDIPAIEAFNVLETRYEEMTRQVSDNLGISIDNEVNTLIASLTLSFLVVVIFSIAISRTMTRPLEEALEASTKYQKDLEAAREAAESANKTKSVFLANMSHEIRTPLNGILGYAQILQRNSSLDRKQRHGLEIISKSGNHLLGLINNILDISKVESGSMELNCSDFDLNSALEWASSVFKPRCDDKKLIWRLESSGTENAIVSGDENKLKQVLINLLGNAVKFTAKGQITLTVKNVDEGEYYFEVSDEGPGIEQDAIEGLFNAFQQGEAGYQDGGAGLGLTISRKHIELMGGRLQVESHLGRGSKFFFTLSLPTVTGQSSQLPDYSSPEVFKLVEGFSVNALVVDDNSLNREVLSEILKDAAVKVTESVNGKEALEELQRNKYDVVFMDMRMPVMNGEEAVEKILGLFGKKRPKIIAVTASVFAHQKDHYFSIGCDDFISKPFHARDIFHSMKELLGVKYIYREYQDSDSVIPEGITSSELSEIAIEADIHAQLKEAAELYNITRLEKILIVLEEQGGNEKLLKLFQGYLKDYNMDKIIESLDMIHKK
ncbi:MAG: response regulator [Candidatus Nitrohelix vancouverensis]|uniref:histidine kinase n=1 Tax=Candidatus Nitrohelix vancouverensis TaxID=2705534 RepID=A0A7T0C3W8_9BACT|nr:MAG: response regulator [Candidatus Nitrohelix vancouverensis]